MISLVLSSEALPQADENRTASISPQGRRAYRDDSFFFFAAETPAKKNGHALRATSDKFRQLTRSVRSFPFLPSSALWNAEPIPPGPAGKGKTSSSAISVPLAKRAVRHIAHPDARGSSQTQGTISSTDS